MLGGHPDEVPLTREERNAIAAFKRLGKRWPASLWIYVGGEIAVMRKTADGEHATLDDDETRSDQDYLVDQINGIDNDGGGW